MIRDTDTQWVPRAEEAIRGIRGVVGARLRLEGEQVREVHITARPVRAPKQIVRDVKTLLLTEFDRDIDHRTVSVVQVSAPPEPVAGPMAHPLSEPAPRSAPAAVHAPPHASAAGPAPLPAPAAVVAAPSAERIRFGSVNLFVSGARTQAQVELRWKGLPRMGSASGWSTRAASHRLIAAATVAAIREFLADELALGVEEVSLFRLGRHRAVVVSLSLVEHRREKVLVGSCAVGGDLQEAVVLATLAALNRLAGGLKTKEPTEYILRPASSQEEAKR